MTYQDDFTQDELTLSSSLLEQLTAQGMEALPDLFRVLLNAAMQIERQKHIGAAPHERQRL
jgi:putative transposase